jgi:hypothetical protein
LLAFPNTYFANLNVQGQFDNLESVTKEVKLMMDPNADPLQLHQLMNAVPSKFGASDVQDLNWVQLLNAIHVQSAVVVLRLVLLILRVKLSPRKIMMDTRDRLEEVGRNIDANKGILFQTTKHY